MDLSLQNFWQNCIEQQTQPLGNDRQGILGALSSQGRVARKGTRVALYLDNLAYGGLQKQICLLVRQLSRRQHEFTFATHNFLPLPRQDFVKTLAMDGCYVRRLGPWLIPAFHSEMEKRTRSILPVVPREIRSKVCSLAVELWRQQPDVFCYSRGFTSSVLPVWAALLAGVPRILVYAKSLSPLNKYTPAPVYLWEQEQESLLAAHPAVRWITNSNAAAHEYAKYFQKNTSDFRVIANGFETDQPRPSAQQAARFRQELGIAPDAPLVAGVFRLVKAKNLQCFVRVLRRVRCSLPSLHIVQAGQGDARELRALLEEHHLSDCCTILGHYDNIPLLLAAADVSFSASLSEGLSNVWLESMYFGCPLVCTKVSDVHSVVPPGCGFCHGHEDEEGMAASLLALLTSSLLRQEVQNAAYAHVCRTYNVQQYVDAWAEEFSNVPCYEEKTAPRMIRPGAAEQWLRAIGVGMYTPPSTATAQHLHEMAHLCVSGHGVLATPGDSILAFEHKNLPTPQQLFFSPHEVQGGAQLETGEWGLGIACEHLNEIPEELLTYFPRSLRLSMLKLLGHLIAKRFHTLCCWPHTCGILLAWAGMLAGVPRLCFFLQDEGMPSWGLEHIPFLSRHPRMELYCATGQERRWEERLGLPAGTVQTFSTEKTAGLPTVQTKDTRDRYRNVTCLVRSVGERTTKTCVAQLLRAFPQENVVVLSEQPFTEALRATMRAGVQARRPWTLVLDADVLPHTASFAELLRFAEMQGPELFMVHGLVYDKFFGVFRSAGNRLYKTEHMPAALPLIAQEGASLRPEADLCLRMTRDGYRSFQRDVFVGLHDFEQDYIDIVRKSMLFFHKHTTFLKKLREYWQNMSVSDRDFVAALDGFEAGELAKAPQSISPDMLKQCPTSILARWEARTKPPLVEALPGDQAIEDMLLYSLNRADFAGQRPCIARTLAAQSYEHKIR